jgi:hypothetical protein
LIAALFGATIDCIRSPDLTRRVWQPYRGEIGAFWCNMATRTAEGEGFGINYNKLGAIIAQALSWLTTYWLVEWIAEPKTDKDRAIAVALATVIELLFILMKRLLFDKNSKNDGIGWAGLILDSLTNMGGILPKAGRLLTFPPIAALLLLFSINPKAEQTQLIGSFIISAIAGVLLAIAPIRLWRAGSAGSHREKDDK